MAMAAIQPDVPPAQLLVSLGWDAPVDLDLHVELPDGETGLLYDVQQELREAEALRVNYSTTREAQ